MSKRRGKRRDDRDRGIVVALALIGFVAMVYFTASRHLISTLPHASLSSPR